MTTTELVHDTKTSTNQTVLQERHAFNHAFDLVRATVCCDSLASMSPACHSELIDRYNEFGFVLIRFTADSPTDADIRANIVKLREYVGHTAPHQRMDKNGIVPLVSEAAAEGATVSTGALQENLSFKPLGLTAAEFCPHTDGSFLDTPDEVLSLTCFEPAIEGGESYLVSGTALYAHLQQVLSASELSGLFRTDAISIGRGGQDTTKPVFQRHEHNRQISLTMSWRCDLVAKGSVHPEAQAGADAIMAFVMDEKNQLQHKLRRNEMLLMDNHSVLHARRSFPDGVSRRLARCNFFLEGTGAMYEGKVQRGFVIAGESESISESESVGGKYGPCTADPIHHHKRVLLMHHAAAVPKEEAEHTGNRHLTAEGREQAAYVGGRLRELGIMPTKVVHSDKQWCAETAERVVLALNNAHNKGKSIASTATCHSTATATAYPVFTNDPIAPFLREIEKTCGDVMMVGHLGFMLRVASQLVCGNEQCRVIDFKPQCGTVFCLEGNGDAWTVTFGWRQEQRVLKRG